MCTYKFVPTGYHYGWIGHTQPNCFDILNPQSPKFLKTRKMWIEPSKLNDYPQFFKTMKKQVWIEKSNLQFTLKDLLILEIQSGFAKMSNHIKPYSLQHIIPAYLFNMAVSMTP